MVWNVNQTQNNYAIEHLEVTTIAALLLVYYIKVSSIIIIIL